MHDLFDRYCNLDRSDDVGNRYRTHTQRIRVAADVHPRAAELLRPFASPGPWAVFYDRTTRAVAGDAVVATLRADGVDVVEFEIPPAPGRDHPICDDPAIDAAFETLGTRTWGFVVAVGAGTVNDIVKMAAFRRGLLYAAIATAPSMNGYTSAIAAILSVGVKTTQNCAAPIAVLADPRVMAAAPYRMIASGIGDLYSKPVSNADWRLSHRLLGTMHSEIVMEIVNAGSDLLDGVAARLPGRDPDAVGRLTGALMLSGLAMQAAGSSMSASGGEHLISHYIDMTSFAFGQSHDFHGCQVAVGTLVTSRLWEHVRALDPRTIDIEACVAAVQTPEQMETSIAATFGSLAEAVLPHARKILTPPDALRARLTQLVGQWDSIMQDAATTLRPSSELESELVSADCPVTFPQIDVDRERAWHAVHDSKDIRARYTILHLAHDLGVLKAFTDAEIARQFDALRR